MRILIVSLVLLILLTAVVPIASAAPADRLSCLAGSIYDATYNPKNNTTYYLAESLGDGSTLFSFASRRWWRVGDQVLLCGRTAIRLGGAQ
jgi:hypothetical protein